VSLILNIFTHARSAWLRLAALAELIDRLHPQVGQSDVWNELCCQVQQMA
jgi:hypothetical protein